MKLCEANKYSDGISTLKLDLFHIFIETIRMYIIHIRYQTLFIAYDNQFNINFTCKSLRSIIFYEKYIYITKQEVKIFAKLI